MLDKNDNTLELKCVAAVNIAIALATVAIVYFTREPWCVLGLCCMVSYKDERHTPAKPKDAV